MDNIFIEVSKMIEDEAEEVVGFINLSYVQRIERYVDPEANIDGCYIVMANGYSMVARDNYFNMQSRMLGLMEALLRGTR